METSRSQLNDRIRRILGGFEHRLAREPKSRIGQIFKKIRSPAVRRRDPAWPVWYFRSRECYELILRAIERSDTDVFVRHQEPPDDYWWPETADMGWVQVDGEWKLPKIGNQLTEELKGWLGLGGWTMWCVEHSPAVVIPDVFDAPPDELTLNMKRENVSLFFEAFLDNCEWAIAIVG